MKVTLLGSGNVATHLGKALKQAGHSVLEVWSRTRENAATLAALLDCEVVEDLKGVNDQSDFYIISVSDAAISDVISQLPLDGKLLIHTSGTTTADIKGLSGVFYPVQTFSKQKEVDFRSIPIAIEGKTESISQQLSELAGSISDKVFQLDSDKRKVLHIAAVFACNFSNHLYAIAEQVLKENGLDFGLIKPLIAETTDKIQDHSPALVQTGPAVRNDQSTIASHLAYLENNKDLRELYKMLSQSIINFNQK
jgi:predicted short-subunit dehydrogenase-like oxidoreductase (DUF2520 family)